MLIVPDSGLVLEKVAEYFYYNHKNRNREDAPDMEIPPELCLELLMAADFLDSASKIRSALYIVANLEFSMRNETCLALTALDGRTD